MKYNSIRRFLRPFRRTPFHPQWLLTCNGNKRFSITAEYASGILLDIGCSDQKLQSFLPEGITYIGIDYLNTASEMYGTIPTLYGITGNLPFKEGSVDTIALLEVLEHLPNPWQCFKEIHRVLKPGGYLILTTPFLYPVHDAPYDFQRFTIHGLHALAKDFDFAIEYEGHRGHPVSTAALLGNLALAKTTLDGFKNRNPMALLFIVLPMIVPLLNICGWLFDKIDSSGSFMAVGYTMVLQRK